MSIRRLMATAAGGLVIALGAGAASPLQGQGTPDDLNKDSEFIREVAADHLLEIRLGTIAQQKATNPAVKQFGERMVSEHTSMLEQWRALVTKSGFPFQPGLRDEQEEEVERLEKVSGTEFDRAYMTSMIQDHQNAVTKFQTKGQSANSVQVRELVNSGLPVLQQHLNLAIQVGNQVGATNVAVTPTPTAPAPTPSAQPPAQNPPTAAQTTPVAKENLRPDRKFIVEIASDNQLEATLGDLAVRKAQSPAVRQYGQRMVTDHNRLQNEWMDMASRNGMWFKTGMGKHHRQKIRDVEKLSGAAFDRAYMNMQIRNHKDYINYLEKEGQALGSSQARNLVNSSLVPTFKEHFNQAKQIGVQVGADTAVTLRSQRTTANK
jgi:putative membrane protein